MQVTVALPDALPLGARERAEIALVAREGRAVVLEARTAWRSRR